jgi:type I restriction enzyme S subunit
LRVTDQLVVPPGWSRVRLDALVDRVHEQGRPDLPPLSVYLRDGVVPRSSRADNHNVLGEDLSRYLVVRPGDLVFNKLRTWQGGFGWSRYEGIASPAYYICRPRDALDPRFADYLLHSAPYLAELTRVSKWQPPSQFDTPWAQLRLVSVLQPPLERQHSVADFLDSECERISALKSELDGLLASLRLREVEAVVQATADARRIRLRFRLIGIEQGWSPDCLSRPAEGDEVGVLKVGAVNYGRFRASENKALPPNISVPSSLEVRPGDLLMSRANTRDLVGSAAYVSETNGVRLLFSDKHYRLHLGERMRGPFLALILNSSVVRAQLEAMTSGASGSMQNISQAVVRNLGIPDLPLDQQMAVERAVRARRGAIYKARVEACGLQSRLTEYRDALITEAVTGQLDVTRLSEHQMDESAHAAMEGEPPEVLSA